MKSTYSKAENNNTPSNTEVIYLSCINSFIMIIITAWFDGFDANERSKCLVIILNISRMVIAICYVTWYEWIFYEWLHSLSEDISLNINAIEEFHRKERLIFSDFLISSNIIQIANQKLPLHYIEWYEMIWEYKK